MLVAPLVFRAPDVLCQAGLLGVPVGGGPPARRRAASFARRVVSKPGQAPPPPSDVAGDLRETVNTFAGVCTVSGETDDTIASQIHLDLVLLHRAKASWVSYRRPEVPALVLTVTCCGALSSMGLTEFAQRGRSMTKARKYSPCTRKTDHFE